MKIIVGFLVILALAACGFTVFAYYMVAGPTSTFRTEKVVQGDLISTINATGTLEPVQSVDVGAQVTGLIDRFGTVPDPNDPKKMVQVDYASIVHKGDILAHVDDRIYKAQYDQAMATLAKAKADLGELKAKVAQSKAELARAENLIKSHAIAPTDYDLDVCNYNVNVSNLAQGEATIGVCQAAAVQNKTNLDYCTIRSPVDGVIIARRVDIGQTVVSNMNASSLFLIGMDPKRIQPWASVNEADIGRVYVGQPVTFTVDAYPGETFRGTVFQFRLNATMTQNVVTYTVVVDTDNSDGRLKPYMTATLQFQGEKRVNVLLVPNAALRWKPRLEQIAPDARKLAHPAAGKGHGKDSGQANGKESSQANGKDNGQPNGKDSGHANGASGNHIAAGPVLRADRPAKPDAKQAAGTPVPPPAKARDDRGRIWIKDGNYVRPLDVRVGATDGTNTEVRGHGLRAGAEVVVGEISAADQEADATNPFAPKLFKGGAPKK
jgi:HlyD family secretion protein